MSKKISEMSDFEVSRWYALINAIDIIYEECNKRNRDFNKINISPVHIKYYIEKTYNNFLLSIEEKNRRKYRENMNELVHN